MLARAYGSMSTDPLFGQAVQAPTVSDPKATPRVSVNQVAPRPMMAASTRVKQEPKNKRLSAATIGVPRPSVAMRGAAGPELARSRQSAGVTVIVHTRAEPHRH